jgi:hypothetical protein
MPDKAEMKGLTEPEDYNYPAALSYLLLLYDEQKAIAYVNQLIPSTEK